MELNVSVSCAAWATDLPEVEALVGRAVRAALATLTWPVAPAAVEIGVELADDATLAALNQRHRGRPGATNVLSFPVEGPDEAQVGTPLLLGDIVLAHGVVAGEAKAQGKSLQDHTSHLLVHGVLHLCGHDHQDEAGADAMEALERHVLGQLGIADPYALREGAVAS